MKKQYDTPEMEIRWFETENICTISNADDGENCIPETQGGKDAFNW